MCVQNKFHEIIVALHHVQCILIVLICQSQKLLPMTTKLTWFCNSPVDCNPCLKRLVWRVFQAKNKLSSVVLAQVLLCFLAAYREVQTPLKHSRPRAVGWLTCPGFPSVVTEILISREPSHFGANWDGWFSHSTFGIWSLAAFPSSSSSIFFCTQHFICCKLLVLWAVHSLFYLPAFCQCFPLRCPAYLLLSAGLVFLCDGLTHPLCEPSHYLVITDYIDLWDL